MIQSVRAWIGRDNAEVYRLTQDREPVQPGAVTRVVVRFGGYCLDSATDDVIEVDAEGILTVRFGQVEGLERGGYLGQIIVYDAPAEDGIMWQSIYVIAEESDACD